MNRKQRRALGHRGPSGIPQDDATPAVTTARLIFYATRYGKYAHVSTTCTTAMGDASPQEHRTVSKRQRRLRKLELCPECQSDFNMARDGARSNAADRREMLAARGA